MNKTWKWILGILIVLVIVAALVTLAFVFHNRIGEGVGLRNFPDRDWRHPMMGYRGMLPFAGGWMFFGMGLVRLIPLVLLGLLVYGAYRLGTRKSSASTAASTAVTPPVPPVPPELVVPATHACAKCGSTVQDDWKNCPYCGKKQ